MLALHEERCKEHRAQRIVYPNKDSKLTYDKIGNQHELPFFVVADFEAVLQTIIPPTPQEETSTTDTETTPKNIPKSGTTPLSNHIPCAAKYIIVSTDERWEPLTRTFKGEDCTGQFIDALQHDVRQITRYLDVNVPHGLTKAEVRRKNAAASECYLCKGPRKPKDKFVLVSTTIFKYFFMAQYMQESSILAAQYLQHNIEAQYLRFNVCKIVQCLQQTVQCIRFNIYDSMLTIHYFTNIYAYKTISF